MRVRRIDLSGVADQDPTSTEHLATRVRIDPPMSGWRLGEPGANAVESREQLLGLARARAARLGLDWLEEAALNGTRIIATGHQAYPWHPGILAKDFAALAAAKQHRAMPLHLVVDQDEHAVWSIDVPRVEDDRARVDQHQFAESRLGVSTGFQPPADWGALRGTGLWCPADPPEVQTLAEQVAVLLDLWRGRVGARLPMVFASDLARTGAFAGLVDALLADAQCAVRAYNRAVYAVPEAGLRPLGISREWVELPLWACRWERPRQRVYADLGDSQTILVDAAGTRIDPQDQGVTLMPRALLMTALMRSVFCDLFIHGVGGGVYDRATQRWWRDWRGEELAPMAVVTADVYLDLVVPTASRTELLRAVWYRHHVWFNIDRYAQVDPALAREKRELIAHMDDDRDKPRRAAAFRLIHAINERLRGDHPELLDQANQRLRRARAGRANQAVLARRDWCFAFYPVERLADLQRRIADLSGLAGGTD